MQGNRGLALYRIWNVYVYLAYVDTGVAAIADFLISNNRLVRRSHIWKNIYLSSFIFSLLRLHRLLRSNCGTSRTPMRKKYVFAALFLAFFMIVPSANSFEPGSLRIFEVDKPQVLKPLRLQA
jgi:hypothetical protein